MAFWRSLGAAVGLSQPVPRGRPGMRAYAVGDIHGRLDLLEQLLFKIGEDIRAHPPARTFLVFLGDLIDRGPQSAQVIERLATLDATDVETAFLMGNHEEILLRVLAGEPDVLESWLKFGGTECAASYGVDLNRLAVADDETGARLLRAAIPDHHLRFLETFGDTFRFGDYLFVHAGIRPGVALEDQSQVDLRWIRDPFLSDTKQHDFIVVHGHTIVDEVDERVNRIAIDTGAYTSGILTALVVEGDRRRYLATGRGHAG